MISKQANRRRLYVGAFLGLGAITVPLQLNAQQSVQGQAEVKERMVQVGRIAQQSPQGQGDARGRMMQGGRMAQGGETPQAGRAAQINSMFPGTRSGQDIQMNQGARGAQRPIISLPATRPMPGQPNRTIVMPNQPAGPVEPPSMRLRLEGPALNAEIRTTPLQQVLEELAAWSGIVFEIEGQENPPVSVNFYRVSLPEAVQRLTANNNSIVYYDQDEAGQNRIRLVRIFSRTPRPTPPSLHYIGTGSVTKRGDDIVDSPEQALAVLSGSKNVLARQKAVDVLVNVKSPAAIQALQKALADPAIEVKVAAIEGLASLGARDALPQILPALKDSHPGVRKSAVDAVALLGDATNVKNLRPLMRDPDAGVAAAVDGAIRKLSARIP